MNAVQALVSLGNCIMDLQLQCKHITALILEMTQYIFLIPNLFITEEMGSAKKTPPNTEKVIVI